jgi:hypothetical protein
MTLRKDAAGTGFQIALELNSPLLVGRIILGRPPVTPVS